MRFYDLVLVHGDEKLVPLSASWPVDDWIRPLLAMTGYIDEDGPAPIQQGERRGIIVSGGSSTASLPLLMDALAAARRITNEPWQVLVGHGVPEPAFRALRAAAPPHALVERARPDFRQRLGESTLSISQAGYNTVVDILRSGVRSVLVPFEDGGETEQRLRAERLAAVGRAALVRGNLNPDNLEEAVREALAMPAPALGGIDLDGARRSVALLEQRSISRPALSRSPPWHLLDEALRSAADQGVRVSFWWRDDDAVAATPALERLIALAGRAGVRLGLAVIPARIRPSLIERLRAEGQVIPLVHGLRHENHAPAGEKKAEFGAHRPVSALAADAAAGLTSARQALGAALLPVFVPPWNRVAPALIPHLARTGYRGLSTFRDRLVPQAEPGLRQVNTHLDPIAWHADGGLVEPSILVAAIVRCIVRRRDGDADPDEPIGLLTHHLVQDGATWDFCEALLDRLNGGPAKMQSPASLFAGNSSCSSSCDC
jgi:hypothetical protein